MSTKSSGNSAEQQVRTTADFQFGRGAGVALFPAGCRFIRSKTRRVRQVTDGGQRIVTVRARDGRFTLSIEGARRLARAIPPPAYRVEIAAEVTEFIARGKNAFARHVVAADPGIRAGDEVIVVGAGDEVIATGEAVLSGAEMLAFNYGVAVNVRKGGT
ncbi:PUA domain-containing protein [Methanofollis fontis]|uniref:Pseudouridine synthase n=1 Tax=Methanofollis fontis TaxID=2052832 RepID=A0A483CRK0_9EURY|nr:PUA domain-containing protein [Methanofollis fontis]TAJ43659.1 pseudouridine synthase [Methanofollis fontis]